MMDTTNHLAFVLSSFTRTLSRPRFRLEEQTAITPAILTTASISSKKHAKPFTSNFDVENSMRSAMKEQREHQAKEKRQSAIRIQEQIQNQLQSSLPLFTKIISAGFIVTSSSLSSSLAEAVQDTVAIAPSAVDPEIFETIKIGDFEFTPSVIQNLEVIFGTIAFVQIILVTIGVASLSYIEWRKKTNLKESLRKIQDLSIVNELPEELRSLIPYGSNRETRRENKKKAQKQSKKKGSLGSAQGMGTDEEGEKPTKK